MGNYSFQEKLIRDVVDLLESDKRVVLAAAPGSGKTNMAIKIADIFIEKKKFKILILTHGQVLLREQWSEFLGSIKNKIDFQIIRSGKELKTLIKPCVVTLPQTIVRSIKKYPFKCDLLIVDEAHQRYLANEVSYIRKVCKPNYELLLTGTPALYVRRRGYKLIGYTLQELMKDKLITDPLIEIVESKYLYDIDDLNKESMELKTTTPLNEKETKNTLNTLLNHIIDRISSNDRHKPEKYTWPKKPKNWKEVALGFQKTLIVCNNQKQAQHVSSYFKDQGVKVELSISDVSEGTFELDRFIHDKECLVLIVVNRGILGFNYEELLNIIDISGSLNVNRIFQLLCRVVRKSKVTPNKKKLFIKMTSSRMAPLTYFVMSYVVALSAPEYFYSYKVDKKNNTGEGKCPVNQNFVKQIRESSGTFLTETPNLPKLLTFNDLLKEPGEIRSMAYTNLDIVLSKLYKLKRKWTLPKVLVAAQMFSSRKEFEMAMSGAYNHLVRTKNLDKLDVLFGKIERWNLESALEEASKHQRITRFREKASGAYNYLKNKKYPMKALFNSKMDKTTLLPVSKNDELIYELIKNPLYVIEKTGVIFTRIATSGKVFIDKNKFRQIGNRETNRGDRRRTIDVNYKGRKLPVSRIIFLKFNGKIKPYEMVTHKDGNKFNNHYKNLVASAFQSMGSSNNSNSGKIDLEKAKEIRQKNIQGVSFRDLSQEYNISKTSVSYIVNNKTWRDKSA